LHEVKRDINPNDSEKSPHLGAFHNDFDMSIELVYPKEV
jgi:hypothetical protein